MGLQPSGQRLHCLDNYTQQLSSRASSHWPWPAVSSPKTHLQKLHVQGINFSITLLIHRVRGLLLLFGGNQHVVVIIQSKALLIKRCNGERERCQIKQRAAAPRLRLLAHSTASSPRMKELFHYRTKRLLQAIVHLDQVQGSFLTFPSCLSFSWYEFPLNKYPNECIA